DRHGLIAINGAATEAQPLTHYPPLFPAAVASIAMAGVAVETAARWLNSLLFGVNIFLIGFTLTSFARASSWLPVVGSLLALTAPDLLGWHSLALSERLYVCALLTGLLCLLLYFETYERRYLVISALALALCALTRYVGAAAVGAGVIALLVRKGNNV